MCVHVTSGIGIDAPLPFRRGFTEEHTPRAAATNGNGRAPHDSTLKSRAHPGRVLSRFSQSLRRGSADLPAAPTVRGARVSRWGGGPSGATPGRRWPPLLEGEPVRSRPHGRAGFDRRPIVIFTDRWTKARVLVLSAWGRRLSTPGNLAHQRRKTGDKH
eukprot:gene11738-biopygen1853